MRRATATIIALAAACAACGSSGGPKDPPPTPEPVPTTAAAPATLDEVKARVRHGLHSISAFSAEVVEIHAASPGSPGQPFERRFSLLVTASGDVRKRFAGGFAEFYDATRGVERNFSAEGATVERRGLAPGPPDPSRVPEVNELSRLVLDLDTAEVAGAAYEGRPAWVVQAKRTTAGALSGDDVALTVDRASGLVVRGVGTTKGSINTEIRLERLVLDPPVDPADFAPPVPEGTQSRVDDEGFRRLSLPEAARAAGYEPLLPARLPEGFELREVAFAERAAPTGSDAHQNPPSRKVISLGFHHGFRRIVVSLRLRGTGTGAQAWASGYSADEYLGRPQPEAITVTAGALEGVTAEVVPRISEQFGRSQLWALGGDLVVTVWGDLDRAELIALAGALQPER